MENDFQGLKIGVMTLWLAANFINADLFFAFEAGLWQVKANKKDHATPRFRD